MIKFLKKIIIWFRKRKPIIHIVNRDFSVIKSPVKMKHIPYPGNIIYFDENGQNYNVINVIRYYGDHEGIWVVVEPFNQDNHN